MMHRLPPPSTRTILILTVGLLGSACAGGGAVSLGPAPSPSPASSSPIAAPSPGTPPSTTPSTSPGRPFTYEVWFIRDGKLFETRRTEPFTPGIGRLSLTTLLGGPSPAESAASVATAIPRGTELRDLAIVGGAAIVDLSPEFATSPSSPPMALRIAQVVYTIGQFSTVQRVTFRIGGVTQTVIGGVPVQNPQTRAMYDGFLPAILVESPSIGQRVSSPVTISGTADVFEATVSIRILDESGHELVSTFTTASCGTGCRGDYSAVVRYTVEHEQPGTIQVFEASAKDGSAINVQSVPVTLTA